MMLYSVRMISANMVSVIVKFLLFKEGYLVEMPTLLMFLMFTVVFSNGILIIVAAFVVPHLVFQDLIRGSQVGGDIHQQMKLVVNELG